jgi:hypothetical protein
MFIYDLLMALQFFLRNTEFLLDLFLEFLASILGYFISFMVLKQSNKPFLSVTLIVKQYHQVRNNESK